MTVIVEVLLWLFVINLGIAYGAGLYEKRIVLPMWFSKSPDSGWQVNGDAMRQTNTGLRFWALATTLPLTLLTIANLVNALQSHGTRYEWWLAASALSLVERIATFAFFIPTAIRLMRAEELPAGVAPVLASRWIQMNYVRDALTLLAWLTALRALSLPN